MKKVGIITMYYKSSNYGGVLQAWALCQKVNAILSDNCCEQICYDATYKAGFRKRLSALSVKYRNPIKLCKKILSKFKNKVWEKCHAKSIREISAKKGKSFHDFAEIVPHSEIVYNAETIADAAQKYDIFITGSDQVWNMEWYQPAYFLSFVPSDKTKFSYAASIAMTQLNPDEQATIREHLKDFKAISVREQNAADMLKPLVSVTPEYVLDPTLLLSAEEWDVLSSDRLIEDDYLFCYFLGNNPAERKLAKEFAKLYGLKIVSIPWVGTRKYTDLKFGDVVLPGASPQDFISLIKHAKYVFTDSFHAVVFSYIDQRQFFVFNRDKKGSMNSRIKSILQLFHMDSRFCSDKNQETLQYLCSMPEIDYLVENDDLNMMRGKSILFLKQNLQA